MKKFLRNFSFLHLKGSILLPVSKAVTVLALMWTSVSYASAEESNWVQVNEDIHGSINFIDVNSIEIYQDDPRFLKFWLIEDASKNYSKKYKTSKMVKVVNCERNTMATIAYVDYNSSGELVDSGSFGYLKFEELIPGTLGQSWKKFVCAFRK